MMLLARCSQGLKGRPFASPQVTPAPSSSEQRPHVCSIWTAGGFDERREGDERRGTSTSSTTNHGGGSPTSSAEIEWGLVSSHVEPSGLPAGCRIRTSCKKRPPRFSDVVKSRSYSDDDRYERCGDRRGATIRRKEWRPRKGTPRNQAAARDATAVSTVRGGRRFCNFAGSQQLVEGAPVSRKTLCGEEGAVRAR